MSVPVVDVTACIGCSACESGCPAEAIYMNDDTKAVINADHCVECLACVDACPVGAIAEEF